MYDPIAIDLWALGTVIAEFFLDPVPERITDSTYDPDGIVDPLESSGPTETRKSTMRPTLFDCTYGDIGLAASIFRLRGSPTSITWPVRAITLLHYYQ